MSKTSPPRSAGQTPAKKVKARSPKPDKVELLQPPSPSINIKAGTSVQTGDMIVGDKITTTYNAPPGVETQNAPATRVVKSAWANGLFYLFTFAVVVGLLGWLARMIPLSTLGIIILAGFLSVPLIGALQLRMDNQLKEKSFLELMGLVFKQLPLISKMIK